MGKKVGDGSCWSFVDVALRDAGARPSLLFNFGQAIDEQDATVGDIASFKECFFESVTANGFSSQSVGNPEHCCIVKCKNADGSFDCWVQHRNIPQNYPNICV